MMISLHSVQRYLLVFSLVVSGAANADDYLLLRAQDAVGAPGGRAVVSLRTYSTRPVGQGTVCLRISSEDGETLPIAALSAVRVFGLADDVVQSVSTGFEHGEMLVDVVFSSASASINLLEGPVAAFYFDVSAEARPGSVTRVDIDLAQSVLRDAAGQIIPINVLGGELRVRTPGAPHEVAAEAHLSELANQPVTLSLQTNEPFRIGSGQVGIRYSSRELSGAPVRRIDARFGEPQVKMDGYPGLALFNIVSADAAFNELPGNILSIDVLANESFADGHVPSVEIDPAFTHLFDENGVWIALTIKDAVYALPGAPRSHPDQRQRQQSGKANRP